MDEQQFNPTKFAELILYVSEKSESDPRFGAVKLNKILYYADFNAYRRLGASITGATYQKLNEGPAPRQMLPSRRTMLDSGTIRMESRPYFNGVQQRILPLRPPDRDMFLPEEREIIDEAIREMWNMSGRQVSDYSHSELGWKVAKYGETIPYQSAWLGSEPIPQEALEYWERVSTGTG